MLLGLTTITRPGSVVSRWAHIWNFYVVWFNLKWQCCGLIAINNVKKNKQSGAMPVKEPFRCTWRAIYITWECLKRALWEMNLTFTSKAALEPSEGGDIEHEWTMFKSWIIAAAAGSCSWKAVCGCQSCHERRRQDLGQTVIKKEKRTVHIAVVELIYPLDMLSS